MKDYKNIITAYTYTGSLVSGSRTFYHSEFNPTLTDAIVNGGASVITATTYEGVGEEYPHYTDDERRGRYLVVYRVLRGMCRYA